ncbi:hypothetical protein [Leifsonia poae]|uniref:hypothetical protein n=1 Tax=Leifsonia poae TaxID=110933 RepID=UPI001CBB643B|nr:hypothetical protein [Leifsonia poae]
MSKHTAVSGAIWFPNQRVIRTVLSGIIAAIPTLVVIAGVLADQWPVQWLLATVAALVAIQGVLTRVMAIPGVNAWLTGLGAGSAPREAALNVDGSYVVTTVPQSVTDAVLAAHADKTPEQKSADEQFAAGRLASGNA